MAKRKVTKNITRFRDEQGRVLTFGFSVGNKLFEFNSLKEARASARRRRLI